MKGVVLAGGSGKRLWPLTKVTNKHLLPVYKKPMIYYPLQTLLEVGIREILIVAGGEHISDFLDLLGSGKDWAARFSYEIQEGSDGTGAALLLAEDFVGDKEFMVVLGDNIVSGDVTEFVSEFNGPNDNFAAKVLIARVDDPGNYGVVTIDGKKVTEIIEKPAHPKSNYVNTGLWLFLPEVFDHLKALKKSPRGEYEVTDVLAYYAKEGKLTYSFFDSYWTDAGSFESLFSATVLMKELEDKAQR
jgi:glucose-1-phosphate thymidylyltransferase